MTETPAPEETPDDQDLPTAAEAAVDAGLKTSMQTCPRCGDFRKSQELEDAPDHPDTAPRPFACLTCGCEFSVKQVG